MPLTNVGKAKRVARIAKPGDLPQIYYALNLRATYQ